jgi:hypothetical protein
MIRTAAGREADHVQEAARRGPPADRRMALVRGPGSTASDRPDQAGEPGCGGPDRADHAGGSPRPRDTGGAVGRINVAAVAAYRASVLEGKPLSERRLAEAFGTTSRRWARNRMAEARQSAVPA